MFSQRCLRRANRPRVPRSSRPTHEYGDTHRIQGICMWALGTQVESRGCAPTAENLVCPQSPTRSFSATHRLKFWCHPPTGHPPTGPTDWATRVAVQGLGNAGQHISRLLHSDGYEIVAVSDSKRIWCRIWCHPSIGSHSGGNTSPVAGATPADMVACSGTAH